MDSVSYTHLDVYKRQVYKRGKENGGTKHEDVCEKENSFCKADNEAEAGVCQKELAVVCDFFNASSSFDDYF